MCRPACSWQCLLVPLHSSQRRGHQIWPTSSDSGCGAVGGVACRFPCRRWLCAACVCCVLLRVKAVLQDASMCKNRKGCCVLRSCLWRSSLSQCACLLCGSSRAAPALWHVCTLVPVWCGIIHILVDTPCSLLKPACLASQQLLLRPLCCTLLMARCEQLVRACAVD